MAEDKLTDLLRTLVRIPSVNPHHAEEGMFAGEGALADFLAGYLQDKGFEVEWDDRPSGRPNLVASYGPAHGRHTLAFEAHMDTVGVAGMTTPPFEGVIERGRLYGRGACDTKGPMAAALAALEPGLLDEWAESGRRVLFIGAMGEETGNEGAERLVSRGMAKADEAIVLEPTGLSVVHAHKGSLWYRVEITGRAAHGSDPEAGISAIDGMCVVIELLHEEVRGATASARDPVLGSPTVNVGRIRGGDGVNVVAQHCEMLVDRRTLPGEDHAAILKQLCEGLNRLRDTRQIAAYRLETMKDAPAYQTSPKGPLVRRVSEACERCGVDPQTGGTAWFSDAGALARVCSEVVVFGPGSIAQAHTAGEYIELAELKKGCDVLGEFMKMSMVESEG